MSRRIRVLELRSVRGTGGGPEKTILYGAAQADRTDIDVTVCYLRDQRDDIFRLRERASAVGVDYVEVVERNSFDPGIWPQLRRLIRERSIDIVHAHEYKTDAVAWLLGRRAGIIPLATAHGWTGQSLRERRVYYPADKRLLGRYPHVIAVSTDIKSELVRHGASADRVTVILNAIDPAVFARVPGLRETVREELGLSPDTVVIGAVGRLEAQKRFDLLLDAYADLRQRHPGLKLVVVGDGSLRASLLGHAQRLNLADHVVFLGHRDDIARMHHAFDLFVQSSEYEGTPNAVLEAMALETPLVATDVGGTSELAVDEQHALIVPPHDTSALCVAIERTLADPDATRARAGRARHRIEAELSFSARTRRLEDVYRALIAGRPHPADRSVATTHA